MFDNEILSPNEKVKKIRQLLRITQEELAKHICTRSNLSQIESGKQKLTYSLASKFTKRLNDIAKEKNIDIIIIVEDIMQDEDSQAEDILKNTIIKCLKDIDEIDLFEKKLYQAEYLVDKYNIANSIKIELYKATSDFYYDKCCYLKSDEMCNKGITVCISSENILEEAHFYVSKARMYTEQGLYIESLEKLMKAEQIYNNIYDNGLFERLYFNKALAYKKLNNYDETLKYLDMLISKTKDDMMLLKCKMLHANCLNVQHKFEKCKKEYFEILYISMKINSKNYTAMTYRNLSELYFNEGNYKEAAKYIKDSLKNHPDNVYINETLYFAAEVLSHVGEDVEIYLLQALEICEKKDIENIILIEKIIYKLILIYAKNEDEENLMMLIDKTKILEIDTSLIYSEIGEYYRGRNEEKSKYFSIKSIEKMKQIKNI